jgi:signal transduction histidine kinase
MNNLSQQAMTILVVEDEPGDFGLIRSLVHLAHHGHSGDEEPVIWAQTLAEGLAEVGRQQPDIVLLDLSLPDSSGVATVRAMRAALPYAPIVVLTGHDDSWLAIAALEAGAQDYLVKGQFDVDALKRAVRHALVRGALESRLRRLNETLEQRVQEELAKNREKDHLLIQQSRLAAMGEMVHNIAHQWRQPLCSVGLILQNIALDYEENQLTSSSLQKYVDNGKELIQKMSATIDDFRDFFSPAREKMDFSLHQAIDSALHIVNASFLNHGITITVERGADAQVTGYPNDFSQVLLNLLSNAKEAILERKIQGGKIDIALGQDENSIRVTVKDNGGGIAEDILPKIFDPYFTTKEKGTGIGLYMSKMIMDHMEGGIVIRNVEDGTEVLLTLPLASNLAV